MITVFREDFSNMKVGPFLYNHTSLSMMEADGFMGKWRSSTCHSSWRGKGCSPWNILVEGKGKVLEQATIQEEGLHTITAGDEEWTDLIINCSFKPLSIQGPAAILFRYQNSRQYYAFWYTGKSVQIILRDDREFKVLVEKDCQLSCDQYCTLKIIVRGDYLKVKLDDLIIAVNNKHFTKGKIGLAANSPVRYDWIEVSMDDECFYLYKEDKKQGELKLIEERNRLPQAVLWRRLETAGFGTGKAIRFGDLNNDGRLEILLAQSVCRVSKDDFPEISCLTALDLDGKILWQLGEANPENAQVRTDLPFQIHDIDGDGKQEVILCKDFRLQVLDGMTGKVKSEIPTPLNPIQYSNNGGEVGFYRSNIDAIYFCDLKACGTDRNIILKDRYSNLWAYSWDLKLLWRQSGNLGHYPIAYDLDGDACDELLIGYNLFDQDGALLWKLDLADHAESLAIGKFGPDQILQLLIAAGEEGLIWLNAKGEIIRRHYPGHCQTVTAANLIPEREGLEIATVSYQGNSRVIIIYDEYGNLITRRELVNPWGSVLSPVNWSGTGQEHILLSAHPRLGGLIDGYGRRVLTFPDDGHPYLCCQPINLSGDSRDEIVVWNADSIWIYTQEAQLGENSVYTPKRQPHYNMSNYRAEISKN